MMRFYNRFSEASNASYSARISSLEEQDLSEFDVDCDIAATVPPIRHQSELFRPVEDQHQIAPLSTGGSNAAQPDSDYHHQHFREMTSSRNSLCVEAAHNQRQSEPHTRASRVGYGGNKAAQFHRSSSVRIEGGYREEGGPIASSDSAYEDEEPPTFFSMLFKNPQRRPMVYGAIASFAIVVVVVATAVSLQGKDGGSSSAFNSPDGIGSNPSEGSGNSSSALSSNENGATSSFTSFWTCEHPSGSGNWSMDACDNEAFPCSSFGSRRKIKCCKMQSKEKAGACEEDEYQNCDISHAPKTCGSGPKWYCQRPGREEPMPVFAAEYCDRINYPPTTNDESKCLAVAANSNSSSATATRQRILSAGGVTRDRSSRCCEESDAGLLCIKSFSTVEDTNCPKPDPGLCNVDDSSSGSDGSSSDSSGDGSGSGGNSTQNTTTTLEPTTAPASTTTPEPTTTAQPTTTPAPTTLAPTTGSASSSSSSGTGDIKPFRSSLNQGVTVFNFCGGDTQVYYGAYSEALPSRCSDGSYCTDFNSANAVFWISSKGYGSRNFGQRTLAEISFTGGEAWWDISLVKGFNYGVKIQYNLVGGAPGGSHPMSVCNTANCPDAYWICDTSNPNVFNPNYQGYSGGGYFTITFCPMDAADTQPPASYAKQQVRFVSGSPPFFCSCDQGVPPLSELYPTPGTILSDSGCGPILDDSNKAVQVY